MRALDKKSQIAKKEDEREVDEMFNKNWSHSKRYYVATLKNEMKTNMDDKQNLESKEPKEHT